MKSDSSKFDISSWLDQKSVFNDIPSGKPFELWRLKKLTASEFKSLTENDKHLSQKQLLYLVCFGILAWSTHDSKPERYKLLPKENAIEIWLDPKLVLTHSDRTGRQALISLGSSGGAIILAAQAFGLKVKSKVLSSKLPSKNLAAILRLEFTPDRSQAKTSQILELMLRRKVVRSLYNSKKLEEKEIKELQNYIKTSPLKIDLNLLVEPEMLHQLAKLEQTVMKGVLEDLGFFNELGDYLLPNNSDSPRGMRGREFGADDKFSQEVHEALKGIRPMTPDILAGLTIGEREAFKSSSAVALLLTRQDDLESNLALGQAAFDLAIKVYQLNNYRTSMHAALVEVPFAQKRLQALLGTDQKIGVVMRIGVPQNPKDDDRPHSARPSIEQMLI